MDEPEPVSSGDHRGSSLARAKKSALRFGDVLIKELSKVVPCGEVGCEGLKALVAHAIDYFRDRSKERIENLHRTLLDPLSDEERAKLLDAELDMDDYYAILACVIQDEEGGKVAYYAKLLKALILNDIEAPVRVHLVKSFRALSTSDFRLFEELSRRECAPYHTGSRQNNLNLRRSAIAKLTRDDHAPLARTSVQNLVHWGYLSDKDGTRPPLPTDLLRTVGEILGVAVEEQQS